MHPRILTLALACLSLRAQDPAIALPDNYRVSFENEFVRVLHVHYSPHQKLPLHDHSDRPTVYVYLTDSPPVRFSHVEEHAFSLDRPPVHAGAFRVSPGRLEKHTVENLGSTASEFLRVELKQIPLGFQHNSTRGNKPFNLEHTSLTMEFSSPAFSVKRAIASGADTQDIGAGAPSLVIALSDTSLKDSAKPEQKLKLGDSVWVDRNNKTQIKSADGAPSHVLQIAFAAATEKNTVPLN